MDNENNKEARPYRVLVVHHSADMDGLVSGAIAMQAMHMLRSVLILHAEVVGYNYGTDPKEDPWLDYGANGMWDLYQFIDVTPPADWLEALDKSALEGGREPLVQIFDHHAHAMEAISEACADLICQQGDLNQEGLSVQYFYSDDECGAMIYLNTLTENKVWVRGLVEAAALKRRWDRPVIEFFPKKRALKEARKNLDSFLTNTWVFDMVKLVSRFDTWRWYPDWKAAEKDPANRQPLHHWTLEPLALDEWFRGLERKDFNAAFVHERLFGSSGGQLKGGEWSPDYQSLISIGRQVVAVKQKAARNKSYTFAEYHGIPLVVAQDHVSFYESEHVMEERERLAAKKKSGEEMRTWEEMMLGAAALMSYRIDFAKMTVKHSFRTIGVPFDCSSVAKQVGVDNGGGHAGAAGCRAKFEDFAKNIGPMEVGVDYAV